MPDILIQCVVVLYECVPNGSKALASFAKLCSERQGLASRISLLLYDNSRDPQRADPVVWRCGEIEYHHAAKNAGLAAAYNFALARAIDRSIPWLLLFDQDSAFDTGFAQELFATLTSSLASEIAIVVPKLIQAGIVLSPQIVARFHNLDLPKEFSGVSSKPVSAMNSGACLRVADVQAIGGFPEVYWLDYLDHAVFYRLQARGAKVLILDAMMEHRLSINNIETEMSLERFENVLAAEWRFIRESGMWGGPLAHQLRLIKRALYYGIMLRNKRYALRVLRAILR